jgi:hypothetical protein
LKFLIYHHYPVHEQLAQLLIINHAE